MINFRFHLVSLIAVFLALGLGILVGSSVVDRVIVNRLDAEIKSVRHESSQRDAENGQLKDQLSKINDFLKRSSAYAVDQRLADVPVAVIAEKGVDTTAVKSMVAMLRDSGAEVPGVLWLDDRWLLDRSQDLQAPHTTAHVSGNAAAARVAALSKVATRLAEPPAGGRTPTRDVVSALRNAGFLAFSDGSTASLADFPARAARALVITGTDGHLAPSESIRDLVRVLFDANVPTVVAEVYDNHNGTPPVPDRGATLAPVRGDPTLAKQISTLDDAELPQGAVTAVIALEQVADGIVGHYGYGQGATSALPQRP